MIQKHILAHHSIIDHIFVIHVDILFYYFWITTSFRWTEKHKYSIEKNKMEFFLPSEFYLYLLKLM